MIAGESSSAKEVIKNGIFDRVIDMREAHIRAILTPSGDHTTPADYHYAVTQFNFLLCLSVNLAKAADTRT